MSTTSRASSVVGDSTSKERNYFGSDINLQMQVIQESLLRRERSDSNNSIRKFSKIQEDGWPRVGLRPTKIPACVEIANGQLAVGKPDENGRDKEVRENNTVYRYQPKRWYSLGKYSRDGDDSGKETCKRGIDCLQWTS